MITRNNAEKLTNLLLSGRRYSYPKGQILQSSDNGLKLTYIKSGFVKRYLISNTGSLGIQSIYGPGDVFPLTLVFKLVFEQSIYSGPETYYYETMTDAELYIIDNEAFLLGLKNDEQIYKDILSQAGNRFQSNIQQLENLTLHTSYNRVAHQLVYYARTFGEKKPGGIKICVPLTHQDLANILSVTRETVSLCISQLRTDRLIKTGKYIMVTKLEELEQLAYQ